MFNSTHLYTEKYFAYISENDPLFVKERIKTTDLNGEFLWLLDEGHCFRDQLVKFCHLKSAAVSKKAYTLGSIETFMRIVENGKGVTFIPEMAISASLRLAGATTRDRHDHRRQLHPSQDARHDREAHTRLRKAFALS